MRRQFRPRPQLEALEDRLPPGSLHGGHFDFVLLDGARAGAAVFASSPEPSSHGNINPDIYSVQSRPFGRTYAEWSAAFWQWDFSLPADHHPLTDTADVSAGQSGHVWFIGGTFTTVQNGTTVTGVADRTVTIPSGTALFFPLVNAEDSLLEEAAAGNPGATVDDLRAAAQNLADHITGLFATVDGKDVLDLPAYRAQSSAFTVGPLPENNLLGAPAGTTTTAVADGYYLMLKPLSVGEHTLHFGGSAVFTQAQDGFDFTFKLDITYHITVAPHAR
jgi:hypothetical protein